MATAAAPEPQASRHLLSSPLLSQLLFTSWLKLVPHALTSACRDILKSARTNWLGKQDVLDLLTRCEEWNLPVSRTAPDRPQGTPHWLHAGLDSLSCST